MKEYLFTDVAEFEEYIRKLSKADLQEEYNGLVSYISNSQIMNGPNRVRLKNLIESLLL